MIEGERTRRRAQIVGRAIAEQPQAAACYHDGQRVQDGNGGVAPPSRGPRRRVFGDTLADQPSRHPLTIVVSPSAATRVEAAHRFVSVDRASTECLLLGDSREAIDDFARDVAMRRGAVFGLHRFNVRQLASKLAEVELAGRGQAQATRLGTEAVSARAAFEAGDAGSLAYLAPIARLRSIGRTLSDTLEELRHEQIDIRRLSSLGDGGSDLVALGQRYEAQLIEAGLVDSADLLRTAAEVAEHATGVPLDGLVLLLDVAVHDSATASLVRALTNRASRLLATVPAGDTRTIGFLNQLPGARLENHDADASTAVSLERVQQYLFATATPPSSSDAAPDVSFFSAPGEGRECVEIARALLREAERGVPFDRMAIFVRAPQVYGGLLETALSRAGIPAWYALGTRGPDPAGRAFLALLACAAEQLSARRFSEYLSLAQVPRLGDASVPPRGREVWTAPASAADVLPTSALPAQLSLFDSTDPAPARPADSDDQPVLAGSLRAPAKWDRLLVESAVIGGRDRWARRLDGLAEELRIRRSECASDDPESPRLRALDYDLRNLSHLRAFALPVIDRLAAFPEHASWGDWLDALEALAPMVLQSCERVLGILGDLRPMARVGPVPLAEVRDVLSDRLTELEDDQPMQRYGRVFVGLPVHARGRAFDVVFVPGLAERIFPQKQRQDPLLLDAARRALNEEDRPGSGHRGLATQDNRAAGERLLLRLAVGAAAGRLYLSYPRLQLNESRPRVPSFYALDVERARVGRVPDFRRVERAAYRQAGARLAWPAPEDPTHAIDDTEHDLAVLGPLLRSEVTPELKGRARYLLKLNPGLRRSLLTRWARWKHPWSRYDGLYDLKADTMVALGRHRLDARPYSVSALQRFALCPYQFLLSTIYRLKPREEIEPLEKMDPLTRGRMFHEVQAELVRELDGRDALPVTRARLNEVERVLDSTLDRVAAAYYEKLAPAIDRVWTDEIEAMRTDLKGWMHHVADEGGEWIPIRAEFGFGFKGGHGRDPESRPDPVTLDGKWQLHGVVDLVEAQVGPSAEGALRVTDHKTGKNRTHARLVVGHGEVLQPVLYGLAVEQALGRPVLASRLFFCTVTGDYTTRPVVLGEAERRRGLEVLEIVDRALENGTLLPAPRDGACGWCDFREVCGPWEETRVKRKDETKLVDLLALRQMP